MNLQDTRARMLYNKQIEDSIDKLGTKHLQEVAELESGKLQVDEVGARAVGLCDWFRSTEYYKEGMTDEEIVARHDRLEAMESGDE